MTDNYEELGLIRFDKGKPETDKTVTRWMYLDIDGDYMNADSREDAIAKALQAKRAIKDANTIRLDKSPATGYYK